MPGAGTYPPGRDAPRVGAHPPLTSRSEGAAVAVRSGSQLNPQQPNIRRVGLADRHDVDHAQLRLSPVQIVSPGWIMTA
jgi:hypothetical protein